MLNPHWVRGGFNIFTEPKDALRELLKILSDCPEVADRITITIKPNSKPQQGSTIEI